jgi:hypothetical protein
MTSPSGSSRERSQPAAVVQAARNLGLSPMLLYARYRLLLRFGWLRRRAPLGTWSNAPRATCLRRGVPGGVQAYAEYRRERPNPPRFLFSLAEVSAADLEAAMGQDALRLVEEADEIRQGDFRLFGGAPRHLGFPPRWGAFASDPETADVAEADMAEHWTRLRAEAFAGDVKLRWELSRFSWLYPLARAYRLTGRADYAEAAWRLIDSWRAANAPNAGPHWMSAQEVALRILALAFGLYALEPWISEDAGRVAGIAELIAVHADRIPATLVYARSLGNNHLVSEAVGLYTAGVMFPEFRDAPRWRRLGRRWLVDALPRQIRSDGGHLQYSLNYQTMVIEAGLWGARLAASNGEPLPPTAIEALRRGVGFLDALTDRESGAAPNLGPNDGGRMYRLSTCPFGDLRPTLQLASPVCGTTALPPGPWDEACVWFGFDTRRPSEGPHPVEPQDFPEAGVFLSAKGLLRCVRFTSRPGHSDQLHLDLWWRGQAVARDPGSYLYNAAPPWDNALAMAAVHNTILVDGEEPMQKAGTFLWVQWSTGHLLGRWRTPDNALEVLAAQHDGYRRTGLTHLRTVARAGEDLWLVVDDVLGAGEHTARVVWQLADCSSPRLQGDTFSMHVGGGYAVVQVEVSGDLFRAPALRLGVYRAGELLLGEAAETAPPTMGWYSPTYAHKEPCLTLVGEVRGATPLRLVSWMSFGKDTRDSLTVDWAEPDAHSPAIVGLTHAGRRLDILPAGP